MFMDKNISYLNKQLEDDKFSNNIDLHIFKSFLSKYSKKLYVNDISFLNRIDLSNFINFKPFCYNDFEI